MKIAITGDSWAYTWTLQGKDGGQTPAMEVYLENLGHQVFNIAIAGNSNSLSLTHLEQLTEPVDCCLFIQTEPVREWWIGQGQDRHCAWRPILNAQYVLSMARRHGGLVPAMNNHLKTEIYSRLAQWSQDHSTPVLLIGGCSAIDPDLVPKPLIPAVPSWCELLFGTDQFKDYLLQDTGQWLSNEYADLVHQSKDVDMIIDWYNVSQRVLDKTAVWINDDEYFSPDNWHPNQKGHQRLVEFLQENYLKDIDSSIKR